MSAERGSFAVQFGENVRRHRDRADISQEDLAFLACVPETEIDLLERGEHEPRLGTVLKLAVALSVSVEALLKEIDLNADRLGGGYFELPELNQAKD
jgi:transcriptional regulator with XRE-family HTH domain